MTSDEILMAILSKPNGSSESSVGFISDLHSYAATSVSIIKGIDNPRQSNQALMLKSQIETLLNEYDTLKRQPPKTRRK
jgi:hypothetical protein|tara:strand:- start:207 stop:443 length:237 start_codon:yes stop_codon:yes gene_type:complete